MIADCIGLRFGGDPLKAADAAGIFVRWRDLGTRADVAYFHPTEGQPWGSIVVNTRIDRRLRPRLIAIGLAHHILRHREERPYTWKADKSLGADWRGALEAPQFADALLASAPRAATRRA